MQLIPIITCTHHHTLLRNTNTRWRWCGPSHSTLYNASVDMDAGSMKIIDMSRIYFSLERDLDWFIDKHLCDNDGRGARWPPWMRGGWGLRAAIDDLTNISNWKRLILRFFKGAFRACSARTNVPLLCHKDVWIWRNIISIIYWISPTVFSGVMYVRYVFETDL